MEHVDTNNFRGDKLQLFSRFLHREITITGLGIWSSFMTVYLVFRSTRYANPVQVFMQEWILLAIYVFFLGLLIKLLSDIYRRRKYIREILVQLENVHSKPEKDHVKSILDNLKLLSGKTYKKNISLKNMPVVHSQVIEDIQLSLTLKDTTVENSRITGLMFGNSNAFKFKNLHLNANTFNKTGFTNGIFTHVYFLESVLRDCEFTDISFSDTQFDHAKLWDVKFENCIFSNPVRLNIKEQSVESIKMILAPGFVCSRLQDVVFENVTFNGIDLTGTGLINCKFANVSGLKPEDFHYVVTLYKTELPEDIDRSLRETHPHLFEKPTNKKTVQPNKS